MSCTEIVAQINRASLLIVHCRYDEAIAQLSSMLDPLKLALTVYDYSAIINPKEDEKKDRSTAAAADEADDEETHAATNAKVSSSATVRPRRGAVAATKTTSPSQRREEEAVSKLAYKFYTYQFESPFLKTDIPDTRARRRGGGGRGYNSGSGSGTSRPTRTTGTSRSTRSTRSTTTTNNANPPPQELPPPQGLPHEPKPSKPKFVTASIYRPPLLVQIVEEDARLAPSLGTTASSAASVSFAVNMKKVCEMLSYVAIYNLALCHQMKVVQLAQQEQAEHQHQQQQQLGGGGAMTSRGGDTSTSLSGAAALLLRGGGGFRSSVTSRKRRKRMLLCLKKALGLYEHSHQILMNQQHHEELATGSKNTSHFILHKMVLVTNLGQIHHSLKDHAKGDLCMDHLVAIVTNVKQKDEPVVDTIFEGSRVMMQGFFTIAAPYTTRHDHAAAA